VVGVHLYETKPLHGPGFLTTDTSIARSWVSWSCSSNVRVASYSPAAAEPLNVNPFAEWSGINALIYYGPLLMRSLGLNGKTVDLLVAGGVNVVQFLAVLPAILYIDKWGVL